MEFDILVWLSLEEIDLLLTILKSYKDIGSSSVDTLYRKLLSEHQHANE